MKDTWKEYDFMIRTTNCELTLQKTRRLQIEVTLANCLCGSNGLISSIFMVCLIFVFQSVSFNGQGNYLLVVVIACSSGDDQR